MGSVHFGAPRKFVLWLRDQLNIHTFVETGTNRAETAVWAASEFRTVITIEGYEPLYKRAVDSFSRIQNIEFRLGDSREHLGQILNTLDEPAIFWLDAHWCGVETFGKDHECPLLGELESLKSSTVPHVILIDDARLFLAPPPLPHAAAHWPDIATICHQLTNLSLPRYVVVYEDVIAGVPSNAKEGLIQFLQQNVLQQNAQAPAPPSRLRERLNRIRQALM